MRTAETTPRPLAGEDRAIALAFARDAVATLDLACRGYQERLSRTGDELLVDALVDLKSGAEAMVIRAAALLAADLNPNDLRDAECRYAPPVALVRGGRLYVVTPDQGNSQPIGKRHEGGCWVQAVHLIDAGRVFHLDDAETPGGPS